MHIEKFTLNADVVNICDDLNNYFKEKPLYISDIIDDLGHQYVDLVQEGGAF